MRSLVMLYDLNTFLFRLSYNEHENSVKYINNIGTMGNWQKEMAQWPRKSS